MPIINKEFIVDKDQYTDVRFQQSGRNAMLKDVLPGNYTFSIRRRQGGIYEPSTDSFTVRKEEESASEDDFHVSLLHLASTSVVLKLRYPEIERDFGRQHTLAEMRSHIAITSTSHYRRTNGNFPRVVTEEKAKLDVSTDWYDPKRDRYFVETALDEGVRYMAGLETEDELKQYADNQTRLLTEITSKYHAVVLLRSWHLALASIAEFRNRGINLYSGTLIDLREEIDRSLAGWQEYMNGMLYEPLDLTTYNSPHHPIAVALEALR